MYPVAQPVKKQYESPRRQEQARETRLRIVQAARDLFVAQGYGRTTMADVARTAGVAVETVYAAFRNKPALLRQVWFVGFRGYDEDVRLLHRPETQAVLAEPDLPTRLRKQAGFMTPVFRRIGPLLAALRGAAASEPTAAAMLAEFDELRLDAALHYARLAAETGQLSVSETECRDVLAATMDGSLWQRLVVESGWSDDRFAEWLGEMWTSVLVGRPA
jgi:TetR/AcrR family transcriptional regulator, regulator of autoinduction and epiphytic fitness